MATSPLNSYEIFLTFILWVFDFDLNTQCISVFQLSYIYGRKKSRKTEYVCMYVIHGRKEIFNIFIHKHICIYTMNICVCVYIR